MDLLEVLKDKLFTSAMYYEREICRNAEQAKDYYSYYNTSDLNYNHTFGPDIDSRYEKKKSPNVKEKYSHLVPWLQKLIDSKLPKCELVNYVSAEHMDLLNEQEFEDMIKQWEMEYFNPSLKVVTEWDGTDETLPFN